MVRGKYRKAEASMLALLPDVIRVNLSREKWGFAMKRHWLFALFGEQFGGSFHSLVENACTEEYLWYRGVIFNAGDACKSIRFVMKGVLQYYDGPVRMQYPLPARQRISRYPPPPNGWLVG